MKSPSNNKVVKKKDLAPLVLYKMMYDNYMKARVFQKELEEHIENNYKFKKKTDEAKWDIVSFVGESLYGSEDETETFIKDFNKTFIKN